MTAGKQDGASPSERTSACYVISPSSYVPAEGVASGVAVLSTLGVTATLDPDVAGRFDYLAGDDDARAAALERGLRAGAPHLWMSRGGYGAQRTLVALDPAWPSDVPTLWAFSDGTVLLAEWQRRGHPAWLAPPLTQLERLDDISLARLRAAVHAGHAAPFEDLEPMTPGTATAPLAGGNLCVLASLVGTPQAADLAGTIVVLEDTNEPGYRVDRLMHQLLLSGALDDIAGIVLGDFLMARPEERARVDRFWRRFAETCPVPLARGLPVGHGGRNAPLPFGGGHIATLKVDDVTASLSFSRR